MTQMEPNLPKSIGIAPDPAQPVKSVLLYHSILRTSMPKAAVKPDKNAPSEALPASYEAAQVELEQLVAQLESGQMPLEQLLGGYQRGAQLLQFCRDKLDAVEQQIKVLDQGVLKPWAQE